MSYSGSEKDKARKRRYYEKNREKVRAAARAWKAKNGSALARAMAAGAAAVEALRSYNRAALRAWRAKNRGGGGPKKGRYAPKLIAPVAPKPVPPEVRLQHPDLGWLIEQVGAIAVRRLRHSREARRDFAVWAAARASLPARPVAAEIVEWLAALGRGEHGGVPLSLSSQRNTYYRLAGLYDAGKMVGHVTRNPVREAPEPRPTGTPSAAFSWRAVVEGFSRLLDATDNWRERAFFTTLRYTGLRVSEVLGLRREHVLILPGGIFRLHVESQRARSGPAVVGGADATLKNDQQRRVLPLYNSDLIDALLRARRETPSPVTIRGADYKLRTISSPYLFPFPPRHVTRLEKRLHAVIPELPAGIAWHAFRHAFAAEARILYNRSIDEISQWLGHRSTEVTRTYLKSLLGEVPDLDSFAASIAAGQMRRPVAAAPQNVTDIRKR